MFPQKTTELSELNTLGDTGDTLSPPAPAIKSRNGSDGDSGVLVTTTDEQPEVFVSENGEEERRPSNTPTTSSASPNLNGETTDEGLWEQETPLSLHVYYNMTFTTVFHPYCI